MGLYQSMLNRIALKQVAKRVDVPEHSLGIGFAENHASMVQMKLKAQTSQRYTPANPNHSSSYEGVPGTGKIVPEIPKIGYLGEPYGGV